MKNILTPQWIRAALIRAIKTFSQVAIAAIGTTSTMISQVDWGIVLSTAALSAVLSILTSLAGLPEVKEGPDESIRIH
jgi:hypothetical protein